MTVRIPLKQKATLDTTDSAQHVLKQDENGQEKYIVFESKPTRIFAHNSGSGKWYEAPYLTFILNTTDGIFDFDETAVGNSECTIDKPCSVATDKIWVDLRATCANGFTDKSACISQPAYSETDSCTASPIDSVKQARDISFFFGWTGTDSEKEYMVSER